MLEYSTAVTPFPCSLLPQACVPRRDVTLVPSGFAPLPGQDWAAGWGGRQHPWFLFPLGSFSRGYKGVWQEQSLAHPFSGFREGCRTGSTQRAGAAPGKWGEGWETLGCSSRMERG